MITNNKEWIADLDIKETKLNDIKAQTTYKINYVSSYIQKWILVHLNRPGIKEIIFVDCMCNAGIYKDGNFATSMRVLQIFIDAAQHHKDKQFRLFLNDKDRDKVEIIRMVADKLLNANPNENVRVFFQNDDVNEYLNDKTIFHRNFDKESAIVLYVDPYDFGTVNIDILSEFIKNTYCEVIFNFFISDYVRNKIDSRIQACIGSVDIQNKEQLVSLIQGRLRVGKMKYSFSYSFKTSTNSELYQILFITPNIRGLELLKNTLWDTFDGREFYQNSNLLPEQISLFSSELDKEMRLEYYSNEAKEMLLSKFAGRDVSFDEIEIFLMENTMLEDTKIIKYILKPLIAKSMVIKRNTVDNKNNYNDDIFYFGGLNDADS